MPVMRKTPERLFTKAIVTKGYGFNTPQDGSVCKIKVIEDEANLLSGLNEDACKEIIVGDVDEPVDRIIEDCIRTMKETEECYIEFLHPDSIPDVIIPVDNFDCNKELIDLPDDAKLDSENIATDGNINESEVTSDVDIKTVIPEKEKEDTTNLETEESSDHACTSNNTPQTAKIQFQLLTYTREPEIWEMSITEKWRRATYHKQRGLELYARGVYQYAFRRFGLTLKYVISLEHDVPSGQEEGMDIKGLKLSCYLNVAACQMRHHNFESVVINSSKALDLQPNNAKALYRRGAAYVQLQEYEKAKEDLTSAQQLEPKNQAIAKQLQILKSRVQKLNQYYASAMKKMFS